MTSTIFKPASDGFSLRAANIVNRHLGNSFLYAKWVDASPARQQIFPVDLLDTHPYPTIWLRADTFARGIVTLFDPQVDFAKARHTSLEAKPSTAYLISLQQENITTLTILLENTPSGKCVLYYRSKSVLAIQEVVFPIFQRDLKELSYSGHLSVGRELVYNKYFGSSSQSGPFTITYKAIAYPPPTDSPFHQPYTMGRDLQFFVKIVPYLASFLSIFFKIGELMVAIEEKRLYKKDFIMSIIPCSCLFFIAALIYNNVSHNKNSPYGPFLINKNTE